MFDQFKESVIRIAKEEEERKQRQSSSGKKKKKKVKYAHIVINAERMVLYDFVASPQYTEQVSVKAGDIVFVFESFEDGWSQVKKYSGNQGVIPTGYLGEIVHESVATESFSSNIKEKVKQRIKVLALMGLDQLKAKASTGTELIVKAGKFVAMDMFVPAVTKIFLIVSRNESYTTTLSGAVRRFYEFVSASLVHSLTDDELAWYSAQLKEDSDKIKAEKARRALPAEIS